MATNESEAPPAWLAIPRSDRPLGRLFALAPLGVTPDYLLRHDALNPTDQVLGAAFVASLRELLEHHKGILKAELKSFGKQRHETLLKLDRQGELTEVELDDLRPDGHEAARSADKKRRPAIPAFLLRDGKVFVASQEQLKDLREQGDRYVVARTEFLYEVLSLFLSAGLTSAESATRIAVEFEAYL